MSSAIATGRADPGGESARGAPDPDPRQPGGVEEVRASHKGIDLFFAGGQEPTPPIIRGLMASPLQGLQFKAIDQFSMHLPSPRPQQLAAAATVLETLEDLRLQHLESSRS